MQPVHVAAARFGVLRIFGVDVLMAAFLILLVGGTLVCMWLDARDGD